MVINGTRCSPQKQPLETGFRDQVAHTFIKQTYSYLVGGRALFIVVCCGLINTYIISTVAVEAVKCRWRVLF